MTSPANPPQKKAPPAEPPAPSIKVRATKPGFYDNGQRAAGDEFLIRTEEEFADAATGGWMEKVEK